MAVPSDKSAVTSDDSNSGQQSPDTDNETAPPPVFEVLKASSISGRDARLIGMWNFDTAESKSLTEIFYQD
jgi:hypothetical protein